MANRAKQKGSLGEYEVRDILQAACDEVCEKEGWERIKIERNVEQSRFTPGKGDGRGSDLIGIPWLGIEVKRQERDGNFQGWWNQCRNACWVPNRAGEEDRDKIGTIPEPIRSDNRKGHPTLGRYERTPVLFSRKSYCPWEVRTIGALQISSSLEVKLPVDINLTDFLVYFKLRFKNEMVKSKSGEFIGDLEMGSFAPVDLENTQDQLIKGPNLGQFSPNESGKFAPVPPRFKPPWEK